MAKNLQAKLSPKDSLSLFDINREAAQKLAGEMESAQAGGASVALAPSAADASKDAVRVTISSNSLASSCSPPFSLSHPTENDEQNCSIYDLSWGQLAGSPMIINT